MDQFTRFLCDKCDRPGFDSWNKAMHDGIDYEGDYPNPAVYGDECQCCGHPAAVCYTSPGLAPTAIYSPDDSYSYEGGAIDQLQADPSRGQSLRPASKRDADWSGGCVGAKGQLQ